MGYSAMNALSLAVELFDLMGRKIAEKKIEGGSRMSGAGELFVGDVPSGSYLLRLSDAEESASELIRFAR